MYICIILLSIVANHACVIGLSIHSSKVFFSSLLSYRIATQSNRNRAADLVQHALCAADLALPLLDDGGGLADGDGECLEG